jgi:hypothetical protein
MKFRLKRVSYTWYVDRFVSVFCCNNWTRNTVYALCVIRSSEPPQSPPPHPHILASRLYLLYTWTYPQCTCTACINTAYVLILLRGRTANGITHEAPYFFNNSIPHPPRHVLCFFNRTLCWFIRAFSLSLILLLRFWKHRISISVLLFTAYYSGV